jgi:hypothetical protein
MRRTLRIRWGKMRWVGVNGQSRALNFWGRNGRFSGDGHFFGAARGGSLWRRRRASFPDDFLRIFRAEFKQMYAPFGLVHVTVLVDRTVVAVRVAAAAVVLVLDELRQIDIFPR